MAVKSYGSIILFILLQAMFSSSIFASEMDRRIESSAKDSYVFKTYITSKDVIIQSKDGNVILTGTVRGKLYKAMAHDAVANLPGVKTIVNNLTVEGEGRTKTSDALLTEKVQSALLFHSNINSADTQVSSENGTITLRGPATSQTHKDLTTKYANDVDGVNTVINEMDITRSINTSGSRSLGDKIDDLNTHIDDASITAFVKATLLYHRSTSALSTTVTTKEGVVTLGGTTKTTAGKIFTTEIISDVYGVKSVVNNMTADDRTYRNTYVANTDEVVDDKAIISNVLAEIAADPLLNTLQLKVESRHGTVHLSGLVNSAQAYSRAVEIAHAVKGAKGLYNGMVMR